ncbi:MAG: hypothetical protein ACI8PZ_003292 [Myxococcota bacterium]
MWTLLLIAGAFAADDAPTARSSAMGASRVALPHDNATVAASPGLAGLYDRFDIHAAGGLGPSGGLHWSASAIDSHTSKFIAIGFAYAGDRYEPEFRASELPGWTPKRIEPTNVKRYHDLSLVAGLPLLNRRMCIGVGGTWSMYNHDAQGQGASGDLDVGIGANPVDDLTLAVVAEHLLPGDPTGDRPFGVAGGAAYGNTGPVIATAEAGWTDGVASPWSFGGGLEGVAGGGRVRAGARHNGPAIGPSTWVTWGVAIANESSEFGYAMRIPTDAGSDTARSIVHTLGIQFAAPRIDTD